MSQGVPCENRAAHRDNWVVVTRQANYSTFNGGRRTPSAYSEVRCTACRGRWRTRAAYVASLPDQPGGAW